MIESSCELRDGARGRLGSRRGGQSSQYSRSCMYIDNVRLGFFRGLCRANVTTLAAGEIEIRLADALCILHLSPPWLR